MPKKKDHTMDRNTSYEMLQELDALLEGMFKRYGINPGNTPHWRNFLRNARSSITVLEHTCTEVDNSWHTKPLPDKQLPNRRRRK